MFKIKILIVLIIILLSSFVYYLYTNTLNYKLTTFFKKNNITADVGIAILKNNHLTVINNKKYPLLSVFKYFVALKVLKYTEQNNIPLDTKITINKNMVDLNTYSPMTKNYLNYPFDITLSDLLYYMISESDNNACDILIEYAGGIKGFENFIHSLGYENIEIKVNEKDMNTNIYNQYLNISYPKDIIYLMKDIKENNILSEDSLKVLEQFMIKTKTGEDKIKAGLSKDAKFYHKTGSGSRTKNGLKIADNDVGYVILPNNDIYYIAIMIKDSPLSDNENAKIISDISRIVYQYFSKKNFFYKIN